MSVTLNGQLLCEKKGSIVTLSTITWLDTSYLATMTLPSEYRPKSARWTSAVGHNVNANSYFISAVNISNTGAIGITSHTSVNVDKAMFSITFPT